MKTDAFLSGLLQNRQTTLFSEAYKQIEIPKKKV